MSGVTARVGVVLVNLDCGHLLDYVLPSLAAQTFHDYEIVVVDNGSSDGSCERIAARWPAARIVRLGRNTGFSHALNAGIRATAGEFVLSLNFDVVLEPGFLAALVDALERRPAAGSAAGAMRRLTPAGVVDAIDCFGHWMLPSRYCYGYDPARPEPAQYLDDCDVFGASACAALYRRRMLEDVAVDGEIFDEDLFAYLEDVDLDWRAQQRGWRCVFTPAARGAHMRGGTGLWRRPEVAALLMANRPLVMLKNDEVADVLRDARAIVARSLVDLAREGWRRPRAVPLAAARVVRLTRRMLVKRRAIRRTRRAAPGWFAALRVSTRFLG